MSAMITGQEDTGLGDAIPQKVIRVGLIKKERADQRLEEAKEWAMRLRNRATLAEGTVHAKALRRAEHAWGVPGRVGGRVSPSSGLSLLTAWCQAGCGVHEIEEKERVLGWR